MIINLQLMYLQQSGKIIIVGSYNMKLIKHPSFNQ